MVDEYENNQRKSIFIISIKSSSQLERLTRPTIFRKTPEELKAMREEKLGMMKPARQYLDSLGLKEGRDYNLQVNLCKITATLTSEQANLLKRQSYVIDVVGDFGLELIE